jgi:hypothetical protein
MHVRRLQYADLDTGFPDLRSMPTNYVREARHDHDVIVVYEFSRSVVRRIDLMFTLLRLTPWAFQRYQTLLVTPAEPGQRPRVRDNVSVTRMPTLYDTVVDVGTEDLYDD